MWWREPYGIQPKVLRITYACDSLYFQAEHVMWMYLVESTKGSGNQERFGPTKGSGGFQLHGTFSSVLASSLNREGFAIKMLRNQICEC